MADNANDGYERAFARALRRGQVEKARRWNLGGHVVVIDSSPVSEVVSNTMVALDA